MTRRYIKSNHLTRCLLCRRMVAPPLKITVQGVANNLMPFDSLAAINTYKDHQGRYYVRSEFDTHRDSCQKTKLKGGTTIDDE